MTAVIITAVVALAIIFYLIRWIVGQDDKINDLESKVENQSKAYADVCQLSQDQSHKITELKEKIQVLKKAREELNSRYMNVTGKLSELQSKVEQLNKKAFAQGVQINELNKEKKSLQNQIAVAWKQVQSHKKDENGVQRTLTGAIDAKQDDLARLILKKNIAIEELQKSHKELLKELNECRENQMKPIPARGGRTTQRRKK